MVGRLSRSLLLPLRAAVRTMSRLTSKAQTTSDRSGIQNEQDRSHLAYSSTGILSIIGSIASQRHGHDVIDIFRFLFRFFFRP